jgi:Uma2 family endonuclease
MKAQLKQRLFSVADYYQMAEAGILSYDERVELLDGQIINQANPTPRNASCAMRLNKLFSEKLGNTVTIGNRHPVRLNEYTELEPDLSLLKYRADFYAERHPIPSDILALIEIADDTLATDREFKLPAYARAQVPKIWLVDVNARRLEILSEPHDGLYQLIRTFQRGQQAVSASLPQMDLNVSEFLV